MHESALGSGTMTKRRLSLRRNKSLCPPSQIHSKLSINAEGGLKNCKGLSQDGTGRQAKCVENLRPLPLKVHKHEIFFFTLFAETETIWSQGPVTRDFLKSYSKWHRYSTFKHFRACSACDEIGS